MSKIYNCNYKNLNYLAPLVDWRILDLKSLREENFNEIKYKNFHRVIRSLEKEKILDGYLDPISRKKFVYLSSTGERELSLQQNPTAISVETIIHDIKVSEITRSMLVNGLITDVILEHKLQNKNNFKDEIKLLPDALLNFKKNNRKYHVAFELELTRKSSQRIIEKIKLYSINRFYDFVIYMFKSKNIRDQYINIISDNLESNRTNKVIFMYHPDISLNASNLKDIEGYQNGQNVKLSDLFQN